MSDTSSRRDKVLISFFQRDNNWHQRLRTMLKPILGEARVKGCNEAVIKPGSRAAHELDTWMAQTRVAVFLVTPDYLANHNVWRLYLRPLIEAAGRGELALVWVPVRTAPVDATPFKHIKPAWHSARPLAGLRSPDADEALLQVANAIKAALDAPLPGPEEGDALAVFARMMAGMDITFPMLVPETLSHEPGAAGWGVGEPRPAVMAARAGRSVIRPERMASILVDPGEPKPAPFGMLRPGLEPPPPVVQRSRRAAVVAEILAARGGRTWIALHGGVGMGKTQLALLVAEVLGEVRAWISFRYQDEQQALEWLDAALASRVGVEGHGARLYTEILRAFPPGSVLVLDDLPRYDGDGALAIRLRALLQACVEGSLHLLSTSHHPPPQKMIERFEAHLKVAAIPPFDEDETRELFQHYGMPAAKRTSIPRFARALSDGHPTVLAAIARFLRERQWALTEAELEALFGRAYGRDLDDETVRLLLKTVAEEEARALLYRLTLILRHPFRQEDLAIVAETDPAISRPLERLDALLGVWVQRADGGKLAVSPLVKPLGSLELQQDLRDRIRVRLGLEIVRAGELDQRAAWEAISYFRAAREVNKAANMLFLALRGMLEHGVPEPDYGLQHIWVDEPLSEEIPLGFRIWIRGLQIEVYARLERPVEGLMSDLAALARKSGRDSVFGILGVCTESLETIAERDFGLAIELLERLFRDLPDATLPDGTRMEQPPVPVEPLLWHLIPHVRSSQGMLAWWELFDGLSAQARHRALASQSATDGLRFLPRRPIEAELVRPPAERRWTEISKAIARLMQRARAAGVPLLWAACLRELALIRMERYSEHEQAIVQLSGALTHAVGDPATRLVLEETLGRALVGAKKNVEALVWLDRALAHDPEIFPVLRFEAMLNGLLALGSDDPERALERLRDAIEMARTSRHISPVDRVRVLGELAIGLWCEGREGAAFRAMDEAAEVLLDHAEEREDWQDVRFRVVYLLHHLTTKPPEEIRESIRTGGQPIARGLMLRPHAETRGGSDALRRVALPALMAKIAERIDDDAATVGWARRAQAAAQASGRLMFQLDPANHLIVPLILEGRYEEGLTQARVVTGTLAALAQFKAKRMEWQEVTASPSEILGPPGEPSWKEADDHLALIGLFPALCHVAAVWLQDPERGIDLGRRFGEACRHMAEQSVDPRLWREAGELLEALFMASSMSVERLFEQGNEAGGRRELSRRMLYYLVASLHPAIDLKSAVAAHGMVHRVFRTGLRATDVRYRRLMAPFFIQYWRARFARARFRFTAPSLIESQLAAVEQWPDEDRIARLLQVIAGALGVSS